MGQFQGSGVSWGPAAGGPGEQGGSPGASEGTCYLTGWPHSDWEGWLGHDCHEAGSLVLM